MEELTPRQVVAHLDRQGLEAFARTGAEHAFTGFDQESRIVHGALDQRALDVQELVLDPVQR